MAVKNRLYLVLSVLYASIRNIITRGLKISSPNLVSCRTAFDIFEGEIIINKGVTIRDNCKLSAKKGGHIIISKECFINYNCIIAARDKILIEEEVTIGPFVCIYDHDHDIHNVGEYKTSPVIIKKGAWIGANVVILRGVTIGKNAVVAAGSVVSKDVPDNTILVQKRDSHYIMK